MSLFPIALFPTICINRLTLLAIALLPQTDSITIIYRLCLFFFTL